MSKSIVITLPHSLGAAQARQRVAEKLEALKREYVDKLAQSQVTWTGDRADIRVVAFGHTTTGTLDVLPESLRIEVQLPWMLAALAGKIQGAIASKAEEALKLDKPKP